MIYMNPDNAEAPRMGEPKHRKGLGSSPQYLAELERTQRKSTNKENRYTVMGVLGRDPTEIIQIGP